jgi:hypothetical protein
LAPAARRCCGGADANQGRVCSTLRKTVLLETATETLWTFLNIHPQLIAHENDARIKRLAGKIDGVRSRSVQRLGNVTEESGLKEPVAEAVVVMQARRARSWRLHPGCRSPAAGLPCHLQRFA